MGINREIRYITAGDNESSSQAFFNNYLADSRPVQTNFFSFNKPMFYTYGGTLNYYSQDPYAIFTNLVRPPIRFVFSAHTESLSGDSYFVHDVYRLDYDIYKLYSDNQLDSSPDSINHLDSSNKNLSSSNSPQPTRNSPSRDLVNRNSIKTGGSPIPQPEKFFGEQLTTNDVATLQKYFSSPLVTLTASTSGITGNIYDLFIEQYVKRFEGYKSELFTDKSQYLINTRLVFNVNLNRDYSEFFNTIGVRGIPGIWNNTLQLSASNSSEHVIQSGPFSGIKVIGNYFTYFITPDKPKLEYPVMSGQLSTFTPEFRWSNGDKADSFLIQISYNTSDTGFTGTVFNYPVEKKEKYSQISNSKVKFSNEEYSTQKRIYTFQIPVKSNKSFIYRVGNSRELMDIFDIRRNVVTFSDYYSATTQVEPIRTYVVTESDSKYITDISGLGTPPSLDYESEAAEYTLSGRISGSTVTGATIQLTYPNSSFVTSATDLIGNYSFSGLETGIYTMTTNYRGYQQDARTINITGNTVENFRINLIWGNDTDTWGKMAGESYYV